MVKYPVAIDVKACDDMKLEVLFEDGTIKMYDFRQIYTKHPQFKILEYAPERFKNVCVDPGGYGIRWDDYFDLAYEELWINGKMV